MFVLVASTQILANHLVPIPNHVGIMIDVLGNMSAVAGGSSYKVPSAGQSAEVVLKLSKNPPVLSF